MTILTMALPKYNTILPISGEKVSYRPFMVKEEKILLLAREEDDLESIIQGIGQIIDNCTFGKCNIDALNKVDAEYLFIQIRNKSLGEGIEVNGICKECDARTRLTLNLDNITVKNTGIKPEAIKISDDTWVTLKLPTMHDSLNTIKNDGISAIAAALDIIVHGDDSFNASEYTMEERKEFVESLTSLQVSKFDTFFSVFPIIQYDHSFKCVKCGSDNNVHIEGIENFFV